MANDSTIAIRQQAVITYAANAALTAEVPASRIYGQTVPAGRAFPFIRSGAPSVLPLKAACVDGSETTFAMHGFTKGRMQGGAIVETAEDWAGRIGALMAKALDGATLMLPTGRAKVRWTGSQLLMDPDEPGCFHTVQNFTARALTA